MNALIVFCDNPVNHFTHVYTVHDDQRGNWVQVDMSYGRLVVAVIGETKTDLLKQFREQGFPVFRREILPNTSQHRSWFPVMPISCVAFTKRLIGINNPFILTPKHLYCHLRGDSCRVFSVLQNPLPYLLRLLPHRHRKTPQ